MEVIGLQIFVSLMLVLGSVLLFLFSAKQRDHEHGDRLALLPLENDSPLSDSSRWGRERPQTPGANSADPDARAHVATSGGPKQ